MGNRVAAGILVAVLTCAAQTRGPQRGSQAAQPARTLQGPIEYGFGNVVFPGGPPAPGPTRAIQNSFAYRLGAAVSGRGNQFIGNPGGRPAHRPPIVAYPVFIGGYAPQYPYEPQPNVTIINSPPQQPSVIINHNYAPDPVNPVMKEVASAISSDLVISQAPIPSYPEGEPLRKPLAIGQNARSIDDEKPTIYLIALKDGTVYSAYAYWVENSTLHYITTKYSHNRASMELVDAATSLQLNSERNVEFKLKK